MMFEIEKQIEAHQREIDIAEGVGVLQPEVYIERDRLQDFLDDFRKKMVRWKPITDKRPMVGDIEVVALQHWRTRAYRYAELKRVNESDCDWRTVDDNSEISHDWTPTHFLENLEIPPMDE